MIAFRTVMRQPACIVGQGCSVLSLQGELGKPHRRKQAVLGQETIQHRLFQAGAALHGEN